MGGDDSYAENPLDERASAVDNAAAVSICYSIEYSNSTSCRSVAEYAYKRKKPVIFIRTEKKFTPDGWLGFMMRESIYFL